MARQLQVSVISPDRTVFEGGADMVVAPAWDGEMGILRGHAPTLVLLGTGQLRISDGTQTRHFHLSGGFLQIADDVVTILSERAAEH